MIDSKRIYFKCIKYSFTLYRNLFACSSLINLKILLDWNDTVKFDARILFVF